MVGDEYVVNLFLDATIYDYTSSLFFILYWVWHLDGIPIPYGIPYGIPFHESSSRLDG